MSEFGKVEVTSTPAESSFLGPFHFHIYSELRHTSKKFEGGLPLHILEKNTVFWKKGVEIWAFDGTNVSSEESDVEAQCYLVKQTAIYVGVCVKR